MRQVVMYLERDMQLPDVEEPTGKKLNFELCLTRLSFIKVTTSVTHASIYRLGSFLEKLS